MKLLPYLIAFLMMTPFARSDMGEETANYHATAPAFNTDVNVPSTTTIRFIFGDIFLASSALTPGAMSIERCSPASGIYLATTIPAGSNSRQTPYSFAVVGPGCYKFINGQDPTGTNSIAHYSYIDVNQENFEGQNHANSTWESQVHANATWESQTHANATWCPKVNGICQGNYTGNFTGNFSGNFSSGNFSTDNVSIMGNVTIVSQWDPYIPLIIYFGLFMLFAWLNAFFPAFVAFLVFGNAILNMNNAALWPNTASYMFLGIGLMVHVIIAKMPMWYKGYASGKGEEEGR